MGKAKGEEWVCTVFCSRCRERHCEPGACHPQPSLHCNVELCDEMGFMFLAESFDEWARPKVKNGYARFFAADAEKDIVNLVHATRNHPCIVMWSSGNEVPDQHGAEGVKRAKWLQEIFHRED